MDKNIYFGKFLQKIQEKVQYRSTYAGTRGSPPWQNRKMCQLEKLCQAKFGEI